MYIYIYISDRNSRFDVNIGESDVIKNNPVVYTRNNTPIPVSESPLVIPDIGRQGRVVGFYRLSGGHEQYAATLCEVVVVGREFVGKYYFTHSSKRLSSPICP